MVKKVKKRSVLIPRKIAAGVLGFHLIMLEVPPAGSALPGGGCDGKSFFEEQALLAEIHTS